MWALVTVFQNVKIEKSTHNPFMHALIALGVKCPLIQASNKDFQ
jgi:hypothetical protein